MLVTKWKIFKEKYITKLSAFVLLIAFLMIGVSSALNIYLKVKNYESIAVKHYLESDTISNDLRSAAKRLEFIMRVYKNEDYILSGGTVDKIDIKDNWQLTNLYNNYIAENNYEDNSETKELFFIDKHQEIQEIKESIINSDLANYEKIISELNLPQGYIYYATDGENETTNTDNPDKDFYSLRNAYIFLDENGIELRPENGGIVSDSLTDIFESGTFNKNMHIYAAIEDDALLHRVNRWNSDRQILIRNTAVIVLCSLLALACFSYLISSAGIAAGNNESSEIHLTSFDKLFTDLNIIVLAGITAVIRMEFSNVLDIKFTSENLMRLAMLIITAAISALLLILFLSLVRHIKNGTFIKHSVIYILVSKSIETLTEMAASGPLMYKTIGAAVFVIFVSVYSADKPLLLAIIIIITTYIIYKKVTHFHKIQEGLQIAKNGDYDFKIKLEGIGEFRQLSGDINEITSGLKSAVQNEVRSEKLKTELITNVSHDIKTPLTSIISYVDLLKREGLDSENAPKYLDVLERKSSRLKKLTEDLFEAAKATSGSIEPKFERVHINSLIEQLLGELDEKIQELNLVFKVTASDEKIYARADGRLLSRVMENLLSNIFKYTLEGSRVYIVISENEDNVFVSFKNISAYELNIPVNELMERFKRGDVSRSSEGSGLGLAIAESLMEVQEGSLELSIGGDLFKAEIRLNKF
ncbi:MAG TPA: HAMP domain-containing sensor histidine kinase [Sedimentibacter sp.]|nr:HAMP domain-containing sensor histidine kinase [Sedimentibacter sp.]